MASATLFIIFLSGFASAIGQVVVLRELLVLFSGNELSAGIVLACWMLWTATGSLAGKGLARRVDPVLFLVLGTAFFCAALPATVVWVRASRLIWSIPPGELLGFGKMAVIALSVTGPLCLVTGCLFAFGLAAYSRQPDTAGKGTIRVYLAEAGGAGAGGPVFYFVLLPALSTLAGTLILTTIVAGLCCMLAALTRTSRHALLTPVMAGLFLASCAAFVFSGDLNAWSRNLQWGRTYLDSRDTPYHNLALLRSAEQFSLFANGLWLYSAPDPHTSEPAAHIPLLVHPSPKNVLLLGDYSPGIVAEILRHPGVERLDCVQPDAQLSEFIAEAAPEIRPAANRGRLAVVHADPKRFMGLAAPGSYDVVILSGGEPVNAEMNRFYTVEFFSGMKTLLRPEGILTFGIPSSPDILGERQALLLKSLYGTLKECFEAVIVVPGETARFFAARSPDHLSVEPGRITERLRSRGIATLYLKDFYIVDLLNPMRLSYLDSVLRRTMQVRVNRDLEPSCYLYGLAVWSSQVHPELGRMLELALRPEGRPWLWTALLLPMFVAVAALKKWGGRDAAVAFNTAVAGAVVIVSEIILILLFQIIYGTAYGQIALIVSAFMAGMAAGSGIGSMMGTEGDAVRRLRAAQVSLALYAGMLFALLTLFPTAEIGRAKDSGPVLFLVIALVGGILGGFQFACAARATGPDKGTVLYAADLAGAAAGAVAASLFLLPVLGIPRTLLLLGLWSVAAAFGSRA
ncbi:MAG: hypothetical protein LLG06_09975 [Desulfobacteraceae bacterium]|nr:hypothetical protein [Desulfobacteraceae bacterium]